MAFKKGAKLTPAYIAKRNADRIACALERCPKTIAQLTAERVQAVADGEPDSYLEYLDNLIGDARKRLDMARQGQDPYAAALFICRTA